MGYTGEGVPNLNKKYCFWRCAVSLKNEDTAYQA